MDDSQKSSTAEPCVEYFDNFYNALDRVEVHKPVFHFVNYNYNVEGIETILIVNDTIIGNDTIMAPDTLYIPFSLPAIQFVCNDDINSPTYYDDNNAFRIANDIIYWANGSSSDLNPSLPGGAVLPNNDLKLRYIDIADCNDIQIVNNQSQIQTIPGRLNIQIINVSNTSFSTKGEIKNNIVELKNISNKIVHPNKEFKGWVYGPLLNHEIGHSFGLCHAQSTGNLCNDIPNDQVCAFGIVDTNCTGIDSSCNSDGQNNIMISGNASQRGFTPCQFVEAFPGMIENHDWRTAYLNLCEDIIIDNPGNSKVLECDLFICNKLIVKTGSELILRGTLIMNQDSEIKVERGARLIIENGKIQGRINEPGYWKGIRLSDGFGDQVDNSTPIIDFPPQAPSSIVAKGSVNLSYIQDAEIAIASRIAPLGIIGGKTSKISLDGIWIRDNETGIYINNYLNDPHAGAYIRNTWFTKNTTEDISILSGDDIEIKESFFIVEGEYGINLLDSKLSSITGCVFQNREIGLDIKSTFPFQSGFSLGDSTGGSNRFSANSTGIQLGGGIGVGNSTKLDIYNCIFEGGSAGIQIIGSSAYSIYENNFKSPFGIISAYSGFSQNSIYCNTFFDNNIELGTITLGNNNNLTIHSNTFDMPAPLSTAIWRYSGDLFRVQTANFNANVPNRFNPPAGNQFLDADFDLQLYEDGNTVDYLVPQPGAGSEFFPETESDYNDIESEVDVIECSDGTEFGGNGNGNNIPDIFIPDDIFSEWDDPIGDPEILNDYLSYLINLNFDPGSENDEEHNDREISRVQYVLYQWVVHMLANHTNFDLSIIEQFEDDAFVRLLVGFYIYHEDPFNADRVLSTLPNTDQTNSNFILLQEINLKRLFPSFFNLGNFYSPTSNELESIRQIAEEYSENTGYASALYYFYTGENVYPNPGWESSRPRNIKSLNSDNDQFSRVTVSPNPTLEYFEVKTNASMIGFELYDHFGNLMNYQKFKDANIYKVNIVDYPKGIYYLRILFKTKSTVKRIIKI